MKVIVCADDPEGGYLPMLKKQLARQMYFQVILVDKPWAWKKKIEAWIEGIGSYDGKVCLVDAYDMAFYGGAKELESKIDSPLIFAGDRVCWPEPALAKSYVLRCYPWKYVNAGGLAGEAKTVKDFLSEVNNEMTMTVPAGKWDNEQLVFTRKHLSGMGKIDSKCSIFHCLLDDPPGILAAQGGRFVNTVTGEAPCFIHGQGRSYDLYRNIFPAPDENFRPWAWY